MAVAKPGATAESARRRSNACYPPRNPLPYLFVSMVMVEVSQEEVEMNVLLMVGLAVGTPLFALGLNVLQALLERWDQQRHAED